MFLFKVVDEEASKGLKGSKVLYLWRSDLELLDD